MFELIQFCWNADIVGPRKRSKHDGVQIYVSRSLADMLGKNPLPLGMLITRYKFFIHIYIYSYAIFSMSIGIGFTPNTNGVYNAKHRRYLDHHTRHSPRNFLQQRGHRNSLLRLSWRQKKTHAYLVGGWTNPSEKYESNWKSSPNRSDNIFFLSCHHPDMNQHREREDSRMGVHHQELLWFSISRWKPPTAFADFSESKLRSATCTFQKYIENSWSQGFQTKTSWITISFQRIKHLVYIYIYIYIHVGSFSHGFSRRLYTLFTPVDFDPPPAVAANLVGEIRRRSSTRVSL